MISASSDPYYDIWALRTNKYTTHFPNLEEDCWLQFDRDIQSYRKPFLSNLKWALFKKSIEI